MNEALDQNDEYDRVIPAGETMLLHVPGDYVRVQAIAGPATLKIRPARPPVSGNVKLSYHEAFSFRRPFEVLLLDNKDGAADCTVTLLVGFGRLIATEISGTVDVSPVGSAAGALVGPDAAADAGHGFVAAGHVTSGAGLLPLVQLFNPAASGLTVLVDNLILGMESGGYMAGINWHNAALATPSPMLANKKIGTAAPGVEAYTDALAAAPGTQFAAFFANKNDFLIPARTPLLLPPGYGIIVWMNNAATTLDATFEGRAF